MARIVEDERFGDGHAIGIWKDEVPAEFRSAIERDTTEETDGVWFNHSKTGNPLAFGFGPCGRPKSRWATITFAATSESYICNSPIWDCAKCPENPNRIQRSQESQG